LQKHFSGIVSRIHAGAILQENIFTVRLRDGEIMKTAKYEDFKTGDKAGYTRTVTEADVAKFAEVSGDFNPDM